VSDAAVPPLPLRSRVSRRQGAWTRRVAMLLTLPLVPLAQFQAVELAVRSEATAAVLLVLVWPFAGPFLWMWTFSHRGPVEALRRRRSARRVAARPTDPWNADHRWNPAGATTWLTEPLRDKLLSPLAIVMALCVAIIVGRVPYVSWLCGLALVAWLGSLWLATGQGRPHVAFARFPYFPGEPAELHFGMSEGGATFRRVRYLLTRVEEVHERRLGRPRRSWTIVAECVATEPPGPGADVRLVFDVPAHAGGTSLSATDPRYWELRVVGETAAGDFDESFLVPIYDRPSPGRPR
jgi:hypothetical protein